MKHPTGTRWNNKTTIYFLTLVNPNSCSRLYVEGKWIKNGQQMTNTHETEAWESSPSIITTFSKGTNESILTSCITSWYGNWSVNDRKTAAWASLYGVYFKGDTQGKKTQQIRVEAGAHRWIIFLAGDTTWKRLDIVWWCQGRAQQGSAGWLFAKWDKLQRREPKSSQSQRLNVESCKRKIVAHTSGNNYNRSLGVVRSYQKSGKVQLRWWEKQARKCLFAFFFFFFWPEERRKRTGWILGSTWVLWGLMHSKNSGKGPCLWWIVWETAQ